MERKKYKIGGRPKKLKPKNHRYVFRLDDEENAQFLTLFEKSGMEVKAHFITSVLFNRKIKTVKIDKGTSDYYIKLTELCAQFRKIGVNYNQIVKMLYRNFSERKAGAALFRLEKETIKLVMVSEQVIKLTQELEGKILQKDEIPFS